MLPSTKATEVFFCLHSSEKSRGLVLPTLVTNIVERRCDVATKCVAYSLPRTIDRENNRGRAGSQAVFPASGRNFRGAGVALPPLPD